MNIAHAALGSQVEGPFRRGGYLIITSGPGRTLDWNEYADSPPEFLEIITLDSLPGVPGHLGSAMNVITGNDPNKGTSNISSFHVKWYERIIIG